MGVSTSPSIVDPLAMVLTTEAYLIWCEIHHPRIDPLAGVREAVGELEPHERASLLTRIQRVDKYVKAIEVLASRETVGVR